METIKVYAAKHYKLCIVSKKIKSANPPPLFQAQTTNYPIIHSLILSFFHSIIRRKSYKFQAFFHSIILSFNHSIIQSFTHFIRAATGFPLIVLSPKSTKPNAGKVASVGRSFPAGFVAFTACGLSAAIPAASTHQARMYPLSFQPA